MTGAPPLFGVLALGLLVAMTAVTAGTVRIALGYLRRRAILDRPNERSSHVRPTPRGGGIGVVPPILLVLAALIAAGWLPVAMIWPLAAAAALMVVSFLDDLHNLPAGPRLVAHTLAAAIALAGLPPEPIALPDGPVWFWIDRAGALIALIWFLNLYNFMDGIDGISGVETASLGLGIALVAAVVGLPATAPVGWIGLVLAGGALGFLFWNWHPAKLFLGDVGSVPLGLLSGVALFALAQAGALAAAIILPMVYAVDATGTLLRRARRGERVWQAHRTHAYQRAVQAGLSHADVSRRIAGWNAVLILVALATIGQPAWIQALQGATALLATGAFLAHLARGGRLRL